MKVLLLEHDKELADRIDIYLNQCRLKMDIKKIQNEKDILQETSSLSTYSLFILNLKNPTDTCIKKHIRSHGGDAPILLILEKDINPNDLKTIYYLAYNDMIIKDFVPQAIAFRIYKLCDIWNDTNFFISKDVYFDFENTKFVNKEEEVLLGKKEALLLKILSIKSPHIVSFEEISCYVYQNEFVTQESIRSLVRQVRSKIPLDFIKTVKGAGYQILTKSHNYMLLLSCLFSESVFV